jgi:hypothetical protein
LFGYNSGKFGKQMFISQIVPIVAKFANVIVKTIS